MTYTPKHRLSPIPKRPRTVRGMFTRAATAALSLMLLMVIGPTRPATAALAELLPQGMQCILDVEAEVPTGTCDLSVVIPATLLAGTVTVDDLLYSDDTMSRTGPVTNPGPMSVAVSEDGRRLEYTLPDWSDPAPPTWATRRLAGGTVQMQVNGMDPVTVQFLLVEPRTDVPMVGPVTYPPAGPEVTTPCYASQFSSSGFCDVARNVSDQGGEVSSVKVAGGETVFHAGYNGFAVPAENLFSAPTVSPSTTDKGFRFTFPGWPINLPRWITNRQMFVDYEITTVVDGVTTVTPGRTVIIQPKNPAMGASTDAPPAGYVAPPAAGSLGSYPVKPHLGAEVSGGSACHQPQTVWGERNPMWPTAFANEEQIVCGLYDWTLPGAAHGPRTTGIYLVDARQVRPDGATVAPAMGTRTGLDATSNNITVIYRPGQPATWTDNGWCRTYEAYDFTVRPRIENVPGYVPTDFEVTFRHVEQDARIYDPQLCGGAPATPEPEPEPELEGDTDYDGLADGDEETSGTDPGNPDTDADDLTDGDEVYTYETDPTLADTDGDGFPDGHEVTILGSNPRNAASPGKPVDGDRDLDGLNDAREAELGTDPDTPDTDGDLLGDGIEVHGTLNTYASTPTDPLNWDTDGDRLKDGREVLHVGRWRLLGVKTDPHDRDTDSDGLRDGNEVLTRARIKGYKLPVRSNPILWDSDADGLNDKDERAGSANTRYGRKPTNPWQSDTDHDGAPDRREIRRGTNPLNKTSR